MDTRTETAAVRNRRMLALAVERGLRARPARQPGVTLVSSHTHANVWYRVVAAGCPCKAFVHRGYCPNYALAAWIHQAGKRAAANPAACAACRGDGFANHHGEGDSLGRTYRVACQQCGGSGDARLAA